MLAYPQHLPTRMNETLGRTQDIAALSTLLHQDEVRLLTLTGPGGVGKTRLGIEVAKEVSGYFRDGVFLVSLAALREYELVLSTIAQAIGVEDASDAPLVVRLQEYLYEKHILLVLDNFEHVLQAGPYVAELLATSPYLKILATSREMLHLYGEHEFEVLPLALPQSAQQLSERSILSSAATLLFVQRAQAIKPSFRISSENAHIVAEICIQLDGLPLAIELAAARIKMLTPHDILIRLQDRLNFLTGGPRNLPVRQQTLRNTLDWSYHLLDQNEQRFFRRLGVLIGHWTLSATAAVAMCAEEEVGDTALDILNSLVDKSFVRIVDDHAGHNIRFTLLETVREYALDRLTKSGEWESIQRQHAQFYIGLAEEAEQHLYGREQRLWLERLDREAPNLWAALRWVLASKEVVLALRVSAALINFLHLRSSLSEGRNWFEEVLALEGVEHYDAIRVKVLYGAGLMASMRSEIQLAQRRLHECEALATALRDRQTQAMALGMLATLELHQGNYDATRAYVDKGMQLLNERSDRGYRGILHSIYGKAESKQGRFSSAQVRYHVGLMLLREVGDVRNQADVFANLGNIMRLQGKLRTAYFFYTRSLTLLQEVGDRWSQAACLNGIGDIMHLQGRYDDAQARFEECLSIATQLGNKQERATALAGLGQLALYREDIQGASHYLKESLHLTREIAYTSGVALLFLALGNLERYRGKSAEAAMLYYEQCLTLTRKMGDTTLMADALFALGDIERIQQNNARACVLLKQSLQLSWEIGNKPALAISLEIFAWFCLQIHMPERAVQFLGTAEALREGLQISLMPTLLAEHEDTLQALHKALSKSIFDENWSYGRTMTLKLALSMVARIPIPEEETPEKPALHYPAGLTAREVDVLRLVAAGLPDARIAEQLVISPRTVNTHLRSIYAKIGVSSRSAATRFAFEHNLT